MEVQSNTFNKQKITQTVNKYVDLIKENKVYQFSQKILLLAHRKQQSKKHQEAQFLLFCGLQKLLSITCQQNQTYSLFDHLLKIYEAHPQIWNLEKGSKIYELLNIRKNEKKYQYYVRFLKGLKNCPFPKDLLLDLISYYVNRQEYTKAESHVLQLQNSFVINFLEKWTSKVSKQEGIAIRCRLALLRGLFSNFQESEQLFDSVDESNPYYKFARFLIIASKLKSKQAYEMLGSRYKEFLEKDQIYNKIYLGYGTFFFKINNSSKGNSLLGMFN